MSDQEITTTEAPPENPTPLAKLTWGEVIKKFFVILKSENMGKQERNFKTAIKFFLESSGLTEESTVGTELTEEFEAKIKIYIEYHQKERKVGEDTYGPRVSKIRKLKVFVEQNFAPRLRLQTLPKTFGQRLLKLIIALGFTVEGFWRSLPKGLLGLTTLRNWCKDLLVPSNKFLKVIETIENHLGVPAGTLNFPLYKQKRCGLKTGQSDVSNKSKAAVVKPYYVWTDSLEQEFQGLFLLKTIAILPEGVKRTKGGRWTRNEGERFPAAEATKNYLRSFMGFCTLSKNSEDPVLRGAGIRLEDLSIALLADKKLVEDYLEFRKLRSGLRVRSVDPSTVASLPAHNISADGKWEFYDKGGKYNAGSLTFLSIVSSLLHTDSGFLYQHPEYSKKLGERMVSATWEGQCVTAWERADVLYKEILKMKKEGDIENYEFGRDPKEVIQWILDLPRPLMIIQEMIKAMLDDLLPESISKIERARQYRDIILIALLSANPLRIVMFTYLKFGENLIRREDGSWDLKFRKRAFKNRKSLKSEYHVRVAKELWPLLDRYREEFHPVLTGSSGSKYVFVGSARGGKTSKGYPMSERTLSEYIRSLTELYIPSAIGFGPHAFRHIVATDIIRKDPRIGFFLASRALHDKLETVEEEYVHLKSIEYFEPVNTHFAETWNLVFQST